MPKSAFDQLSRAAADRGLLIEAGWIGLRLAALPADTPPAQIAELRSMFFAGAQHLFASIITILDPGTEPTAADLAKMDLIDAELRAFIAEFTARLPTVGSA